ncbi:MAG: hypothetical protein IT429_13120 [Gemmataceae bacterium]|nr:hypothetical protein [Gemmataceae bacterium]
MPQQRSEPAAFADAPPRVVERVTAPIDRDEVRRYLGYPKGARPAGRIEATLDHWIGAAADRAAPRAAYRVFRVADAGRRHLRLETPDGTVEFTGAIGEFLGPVTRVAVFIATAGPAVEQLAAELLRQGDALGGLVVNAVGSERAEAAEAAVIAELQVEADPAGVALTLPYSPGYCGMSITEQRKLFAALDGGRVGVSLSPDCLMTPLKSVSGLIGLGPADPIRQQGSPCDRCTLHTCAMRR